MSSKTIKFRPEQHGSSPLERPNGKPGPYSQASMVPARPAPPSVGASFELLFASNPIAMYVYNRQSLSFLEVNAAAIGQYGYSRDQFLGMKITDIRPHEDIPRLLDV